MNKEEYPTISLPPGWIVIYTEYKDDDNGKSYKVRAEQIMRPPVHADEPIVVTTQL